jgi:hypothetical protein
MVGVNVYTIALMIVLLCGQLPLYFFAAYDKFSGGSFLYYLNVVNAIWTAVLICFILGNAIAEAQMIRLQIWTSKKGSRESSQGSDVQKIIRRIKRTALLFGIETIIQIVLIRLQVPFYLRTIYSNPSPDVDGYDLIFRLAVTGWMVLFGTALGFIYPNLYARSKARKVIASQILKSSPTPHANSSRISSAPHD